MESQSPKVAMYVKRTFGEKLSASFDFIKENWKLLLKYTTYFLLPVSLIQALSLNGLMGGIVSFTNVAAGGGLVSEGAWGLSFLSYYGFYMLVYIIGTVLLSSLVYGLMRIYNEREERLKGVTFEMLKPVLMRNIGRVLLIALWAVVLATAFFIVMIILSIAFPFILILMVPAVIVFAVPLAIWAPVYLFEDISIVGSLKKAYRLGFATWGGVFLVSFVMGIIAGILQGVTMMPWYILTLVKTFLAMNGTESAMTVSTGYNFVLYLLGVVQAFGAYVSMIITLVGLAYQYGHASEKLDNVTVESDIDNFDKL